MIESLDQLPLKENGFPRKFIRLFAKSINLVNLAKKILIVFYKNSIHTGCKGKRILKARPKLEKGLKKE